MRREVELLRVLKRACYTLAHSPTLSHTLTLSDTLTHSHTLSHTVTHSQGYEELTPPEAQEVVRVRREIELMGVLKHSNIVQLHQVQGYFAHQKQPAPLDP